MNITQEHLSYWRERKSTPRWASVLPVSHFNPEPAGPRVSIHRIVNLNAGLGTKRCASNNTIYLLRLARKNGNLLDCIKSCAERHPSNHPRRAAWCKKWLKRLEQQRRAA
jgi:hypothetical protein